MHIRPSYTKVATKYIKNSRSFKNKYINTLDLLTQTYYMSLHTVKSRAFSMPTTGYRKLLYTYSKNCDCNSFVYVLSRNSKTSVKIS